MFNAKNSCVSLEYVLCDNIPVMLYLHNDRFCLLCTEYPEIRGKSLR